jgi:hypothetical protein
MTRVELDASHIRDILKSRGWRVRGSGGAAERLVCHTAPETFVRSS